MTDVVSTIWAEYIEIGSSVLNEKKLNYMFIETESSYIICTHLYGYIVVFISDNNNSIGLMKAYLDSLSKTLYEKFSPFEQLISDRQEESEA